MRKLIASLAGLGTLAMAAPALAQDRLVIIETDKDGPTAEVGVQAGYPSGLTGKMWLDDGNAIDVGLGWVPATDSTIGYVDYLFHTDSLVGENVKVPLYVGVGVRGINYDDRGLNFAVGPRMPVGVTAVFTELPISMYAEIAPTAEFDGDGNTFVTADAGVGARVWF